MRTLQLTSADVAVDAACLLGEGPTWDAVRARLLWLDIEGRVLHQLDRAGSHSQTPLDRTVTAVVPDIAGSLVAAADGAVVRLDPTGAPSQTIATLPSDGDGVTNDARCDPLGRLWVGTVDRSGAGRGGVFCVSAGGDVTQVRRGVGLSNGLDWSPDGRICHYVDSFTRRVDSIHLDEAGLPVRTEVLVEIDATPDGLTVDSDGGVWVALWDGGAVHRYSPSGRLDTVVRVPGGFVTSCAFGGPGLDTLYVTTARTDGRTEPHAGALFALDAGVTGRGYTPFAAGSVRHNLHDVAPGDPGADGAGCV